MRIKAFRNILFLLLAATIFYINCSVLSHPVQAEEKLIELENSKSKIDHAAYYQAIGEQMARCVDDVKGFDNDNVFNGGEKMEIFQSGTLWNVGPWLEKEITGKVDDGRIRCYEGDKEEGDRNGKDGILRLFADVIDSGDDLEDKKRSILCNWWDKDYPGLIQRDSWQKRYLTGCDDVWWDKAEVGSYFDDRGDTLNFDEKGRFPGEYSTGWQYLKLVWDFWKNNEEYEQVDKYDEPNEYIDDLGDIEDTWDDADFHFLYRKDLKALCPFNNLGGNAQDDSFEILALNSEDASLKVEPIEFENEDKHAWGSGSRLHSGERQATCMDILAAVNETYDGYRDKVQKAFKKDCDNNDAVKQAWKLNYIKATIITGADPESNEPMIVGPNGSKYLVRLIQEEKQYLPEETLRDWDNNNKAWRNYKEVVDEDGNTKYEILEFDEQTKESAQKTIEDYEKYKQADSYFSYKNENNKDDGVICNVPEGYTISVNEGDSNSDDDDPSSADSDPCYDAGVEGMSWVLCPTINNTAHAMDTFEKALRTMLSIESNKLFGSNTESYKIWETFRNIANVVLIIIFLVIIFSQLTGYGIDNYGIKKMLPKLIVMAILINLSYILCELAVDLSNILGVGLDNLFRGLAGDYADQTSTYDIVFTLLASVAGAAGAAVYIYDTATTGGGTALVVALVFALLGAIVIAFLFLAMVGLRMIIVVVFTVISPVAFALYILPNTQSLFKKWWKVLEAALVVYPICGALYGAHYVVKAILLSQQNENFFMGVAAVIGPYLPFVALPSLLKGALAGLGAVAGAVTTIGSGIRKGARSGSDTIRSAIKGSERYRSNVQDRERNRKLNFARRTNERLSRRNSETLSDRQRRQLASARMIESAEYAENLKRDAIVDGNRYEAMRAGIRAKDEDQAINDRLALMRSSGESGGIMVGGQKVAYTLDNLNARMQELERKSRSAALSSDEQSEMAALARGMVSQKGGAGMLNNIVRNAGNQDATGKHQLNANFMSSLGQIYNNDSTVASKMTEKDGGMGGYMERFMPGGDGVNRNESFDDYFADNSNNGYAGNASRRIKSHEAGLNQSGEAFRYYLGTLTKDQAQSIMDNQPLLNSLDVDNRTEFISHARTLGVTGPSARDVNVINVPHTP